MSKDNETKLEKVWELTVILEDYSLRKLNGFVQVPKIVLMHQNLSYGAKVAYGVLLGYAWQDDFCYPAQESIARDLSCSTRQVRRLLTELKDRELISWKQQGLNRPNIYFVLPLKTEKATKTLDRTNMSIPDRTNMSIQERTNTSYKEESKLIYTKPLNVTNGNKKSHLRKLKNLDQPIEQTTYLTDEILNRLGDKHSTGFYRLVASKIPEHEIRQALSEIKVDGANNPARVFTYRMENYAKKKLGTT